jgi:hypothetical protein
MCKLCEIKRPFYLFTVSRVVQKGWEKMAKEREKYGLSIFELPVTSKKA